MKHLILLFDGTWNSAATGSFNDITNIFRLNLAIRRHDVMGNPQVIFYMPGPGTRGLADEQMGGAFGQGIDQIIREAYVNLASNYEDGDNIYLFGFSRGAVAARALSCLIAESGLLQPGKLHLLPTAWKRFVNINRGAELHPDLKDLSDSVHDNVRIKFIGLFDSVLGRDAAQQGNFSELMFSNKALSPIVDYGIHIVSMDDDRKIFAPILWDSYDHETQVLEQIWMPGVHSDVGGTGKPHFLGVTALLTMITKICDRTALRVSDEFMSEFITRLRLSDHISISNERVSPIWALFARGSRRIPEDGKEQYVHPIVDILYGRTLMARGYRSGYDGDHLREFMALPRYFDMQIGVIRHAAIETLGRMI